MREAGKTCVKAATILFLLLPLMICTGCTIGPPKNPTIFDRTHLSDRDYVPITFHNDSLSEDVEVALLGQAATIDPLPPVRTVPKNGTFTFWIPRSEVGRDGAEMCWRAPGRIAGMGGHFTMYGEPKMFPIPVETTLGEINRNQQKEDEQNKQTLQVIDRLIGQLKNFKEDVTDSPGKDLWTDTDLNLLKDWVKGKKPPSGGTANTTTESASETTSPNTETPWLVNTAIFLRATIANSFHRLGRYYEKSGKPIEAACCYVRASQLDCPQAKGSIAAMLAKEEAEFTDNWTKHLKTDSVLTEADNRMYFEHDFVPGASGKLLEFNADGMHYKIEVHLGQTQGFPMRPIDNLVPYSEDLLLGYSSNEIKLRPLLMAAVNDAPWAGPLWTQWRTIRVLRQDPSITIDKALAVKEPPARAKTTGATTEPANKTTETTKPASRTTETTEPGT